jgi:hypothetical protein
MIVCFRFKRVRRLLHRYVLPALCPTFLAMTAAGCALASTATQPPDRGFVADGHGALQFPFRGVNRATVIEQFGQPDSVERVNGQEVDVYESDPDSPYHKWHPESRWFDFVDMLLVDVVTAGVADLSVTLPSLGEKREYYVYSVAYSPEGKVESVSTERKKYWLPPPPLTLNATGCTPNC